MYTYDTLAQDIKSTLEEDSAEFDAALPLVIAKAQSYVQRKVDAAQFIRFEDLTLTAGVRTLDLPSDTLILKSIRVEGDDGWVELIQQTNEFLTVVWPVFTSTGAPTYYASRSNTGIFIAPTPSANAAANIEYIARVTTLSSTAPSNWISENLGTALFAAGMYYANLWAKNQSAAQMWKSNADEELLAANNEARRVRRSDSVDRNEGSPENNIQQGAA